MTSHPRDYSRIVFIVSAALLVFGYGFVVGSRNVFPYRIIKAGVEAVEESSADLTTRLGARPGHLLMPARYRGDGVTRNVAGRATPGLTLLAAFIKDTNELRLIDLDGTVVQRWPVNFAALFPDQSHIVPPKNRPKSEWNTQLHGALALPDGSVVFDYEYMGLVKLDRCGNTVWTVTRMIHHRIEPSEDGGFWVGSRNHVPSRRAQYPMIAAPFFDETVLKVSSTGKVQQEFSVLDLIVSQMPGAFFGNADHSIPNGDFMHLNDIEELTSNLAPVFPRFRRGDLILSLRGLSMLLMVDPQSKQIKWHQVGRWTRQHDPDFRPSGLISVMSNGLAGAPGPVEVFGRSSILELNPENGTTTVNYGLVPEQPMFTEWRGKHQYLDYADGNLLVTESNSGRVFEVDDRKEVVWEYINRYDDDEVAVIFDATRYPVDYFGSTTWSCS